MTDEREWLKEINYNLYVLKQELHEIGEALKVLAQVEMIKFMKENPDLAKEVFKGEGQRDKDK